MRLSNRQGQICSNYIAIFSIWNWRLSWFFCCFFLFGFEDQMPHLSLCQHWSAWLFRNLWCRHGPVSRSSRMATCDHIQSYPGSVSSTNACAWDWTRYLDWREANLLIWHGKIMGNGRTRCSWIFFTSRSKRWYESKHMEIPMNIFLISGESRSDCLVGGLSLVSSKWLCYGSHLAPCVCVWNNSPRAQIRHCFFW